ncbi:MAG TPA: glycosyltransferase [Phototrophicaceae bacterium]|jgi:glycosyltransferase involved in cell wall biosynthesis|nr:glycosyltransferase [Phototrophicaceae bacterium]
MNPTNRITLIATVLNEGESISRLMQSLVEQTRQPDEIIIVDGGSRDQTVEIIQRYQDRLSVKIIVKPGCNISTGRNTAIAAAQEGIIAATDAGVRFPANWLEKLTQPFLDNSQIEMVGGFFLADPQTIFEAAMGATVLPVVDEINPATFLPSSRSVAFRKKVWEQIEGYPEWLDYCEDLIFDLRIKAIIPASGFAFAHDAVVYFRPRSSLRSFYKQYYLYARGDGKADLWRKRHLIRYVTYLVIAPLVFLIGLLIHPLFWLLYLPGAAFYLYRSYRRLPDAMNRLSEHKQSLSAWLYALGMILVIRVVGDVAKMIGYPVGWRWRLQHQPLDWQIDPTKFIASDDKAL